MPVQNWLCWKCALEPGLPKGVRAFEQSANQQDLLIFIDCDIVNVDITRSVGDAPYVKAIVTLMLSTLR